MHNLLYREFIPKHSIIYYCLGNRGNVKTTADFDKFLHVAHELVESKSYVFKSASELFAHYSEEIPVTMQGVVFYERKEISEDYFYELCDALSLPTFETINELNTILQ